MNARGCNYCLCRLGPKPSRVLVRQTKRVHAGEIIVVKPRLGWKPMQFNLAPTNGDCTPHGSFLVRGRRENSRPLDMDFCKSTLDRQMLARPRMAIGRIRVKQVPFFRRECSFIEKLSWAFRASNGGRQVILIAQMILQKIHRLSLILVGLFSLATNGSLVLMPNGSLSLVTVGREDRRGPTTTDVFFAISFGL